MLQSILFEKYIIDEYSYERRGKSVEDFELKHIDVPRRQEASRTDDNESIYAMRHMQEYKGVPYSWEVALRNDQVNVLPNLD